MGKSAREKGRRGERVAKLLLADRDWQILADTTAGLSTDDLVCMSPDGKVVSVEVKNCKQIDVPAFVRQARTNAKKNAWMLMCHISGTASWLILGSGRTPVVWHEKSTMEMDNGTD